ncbi:MAG: EpsI family protein [Betaproteobacteria bacterium]|nr:EpsI family protein [Betaproteobacteria bacterium]
MNAQSLIKPILLAILMLIAAGLTIAATPRQRMADLGPKLDLEQIVPESLGDWRIDRSIMPVVPAPDVQAKLDQIYNQTLARTYVDKQGNRVMLSIAYGGDQSDAMRAHRPEVCYAAQGFQVVRSSLSQVATQFGVLPVKRLIATKGTRHEPITYWIVVGDNIVLDGLQQKLAQLRYGLTGTIPDGVLVRVSTIDTNSEHSFQVQDRFLKTFVSAIEGEVRARIAGRFETAG